jgi:hypothetical protein
MQWVLDTHKTSQYDHLGKAGVIQGSESISCDTSKVLDGVLPDNRDHLGKAFRPQFLRYLTTLGYQTKTGTSICIAIGSHE